MKRRILSILLALTMTVGLAMPALADETPVVADSQDSVVAEEDVSDEAETGEEVLNTENSGQAEDASEETSAVEQNQDVAEPDQQIDETATVTDSAEITKYVFDCENPIAENLNISFATTSGEQVTSTASGKAKVLYFYKDGCRNSEAMSALLKNNTESYENVDVYAIEIAGDANGAAQYTATYGRNDIRSCFDVANAVEKYAKILDQDCTSTMMYGTPFVVYINTDNQIVGYTEGMNDRILSDIEILAGNTIALESTEGATEFVTRLYNVCLDRGPDPAGLENWVSQLESGQNTGAGVAAGFIFSDEFKNKNYCNKHYIEYLYKAFLGREPDSAGWDSWIQSMKDGSTREAIFNGFVGSDEFSNLCASYGIIRGNGISEPTYGTVSKGTCPICGEQDGVTAFVTRFYNICLDRDPDAPGLENWTSQLWNHTGTGASVAYGFIFSQEFTNKNLSNGDYVEVLYNTFLGRGSDPSGYANWVGQLDSGTSRLSVFYGFVGSQEFKALCKSYGILPAKTGFIDENGAIHHYNDIGLPEGGWFVYNGVWSYFSGSDAVLTTQSNGLHDAWCRMSGNSSGTNYYIVVDTSACKVYIFQGGQNNWSPLYEWACSPGAPSTPTVKGEFTIQSRGYSFGSGYTCYYWTQFYGNYLFHSVLYYQNTFNIQDGRLGMQLSHGCVRLDINNAQWINANIPSGTKVLVY